MSEKSIAGGTTSNEAVILKPTTGPAEPAFGINDIDMRPNPNETNNRNPKETNLPAAFNHIEISTMDRVADKDGFMSKESLEKAAKDPTLDDIQKDDVQHMLDNFQLLADVVDDKDGGKKGISREDIAKYNFPHEINHIETSSIDKLTKAADGSITKDALEKALQRTDLSDVERDDLEYLQRQYNNVKGLAGGAEQGAGISQADITEFNKRADLYSSSEDYRFQRDQYNTRDPRYRPEHDSYYSRDQRERSERDSDDHPETSHRHRWRFFRPQHAQPEKTD